jgi:hypothetical protein
MARNAFFFNFAGHLIFVAKDEMNAVPPAALVGPEHDQVLRLVADFQRTEIGIAE